jgi:geranylgeranyl pyrophosphate synthase
LNNAIAILDLVKDELKQVEAKMREPPRPLNSLKDGDGASARPYDARYDVSHPLLNQVIERLLDSGGKRVRPALTLLISRVYAVEREKAIALAAAIELLHTATLVHDDLIDGALLRRGHPTLNATWPAGATVLAGDYLFARAAELAAETEHVQGMRVFAHTLMVICSGEIRQMFDKRAHMDRQQYYERIYAKTAALFSAATEAAGVLGDVSPAVQTALREYGEQLGMAFQIVDDVLDFAGDQQKLGKPVGSDLRAGLVTMPTLWFLERYPDHKLVQDILNDGHKDDTSIQTAVRLIRDAGATEAALDEARQFIRRSQAALETLPPGQYRDALRELGDFVVDRQR